MHNRLGAMALWRDLYKCKGEWVLDIPYRAVDKAGEQSISASANGAEPPSHLRLALCVMFFGSTADLDGEPMRIVCPVKGKNGSVPSGRDYDLVRSAATAFKPASTNRGI